MVIGAKNKDWEAIVVGKEGQVWILDVGDNGAKRKKVSLHRFDPRDIVDGKVNVNRTIKVKYPNGARDVEAAVYVGRLDKILLIGKRYFKKAPVAWVDVSADSPDKQDAPPSPDFGGEKKGEK